VHEGALICQNLFQDSNAGDSLEEIECRGTDFGYQVVFQTLMNDVLRDMLDVFVVLYLDDILVFYSSGSQPGVCAPPRGAPKIAGGSRGLGRFEAYV